MTTPPLPRSAPLIFDRARYARQRSRAADGFEDYAFLKSRLSSDLAERLGDTSRTFQNGLELCAAGGELSAALLACGKAAGMVAADVSPAFTQMARARGIEALDCDEEAALSLGEARFDLVVSALGLHWVNDLPGTLIQIRRALQPDGLFVAALFGAGTLAELRSVLTQAESELTGSLALRLSPLPALAEGAALLQRAGFALPVADRDTVLVRYSTLSSLFSDLRGMGERAAFTPGLAQPLPRRVLARAEDLYRERFSDPDGKLRVSFEIVWLAGWSPAPHQPQPLKPGSARASLADAVRQAGGTSSD